MHREVLNDVEDGFEYGDARAPLNRAWLKQRGRIEAGEHYSSRFELMRDVALNLFWTNRFAMTMYDKRPTRWRDVPRTRDDVFLPVLTPWEGWAATRCLLRRACRGSVRCAADSRQTRVPARVRERRAQPPCLNGRAVQSSSLETGRLCFALRSAGCARSSGLARVRGWPGGATGLRSESKTGLAPLFAVCFFAVGFIGVGVSCWVE